MKKIKAIFIKISAHPLQTCLVAWLLFLGMYVIVGILTGFLDFTVQTAFMIAAPAGLLGFTFWCTAFIYSIRNLKQKKDIVISIIALIGSLLPLGFIGIGFYITIFLGGV